MSLTVPFALRVLASAASVVVFAGAASAQDATAAPTLQESGFAWGAADLARIADTGTSAFRFRDVRIDISGAAPRYLAFREGVRTVRVADAAVTAAEYGHARDEQIDGFKAFALEEHARLATGESASRMAVEGSGKPDVLLSPTTDLPEWVFLAHGRLPPRFLATHLVSAGERSTGTDRVSFALRDDARGESGSLDVIHARTARTVTLRLTRPRGARETIQLVTRPSAGAEPETCLQVLHIEEDANGTCAVRALTRWENAEIACDALAPAARVPALDFRAQSDRPTSSVLVDRPLSLGDFLQWPYARATRPPADPSASSLRILLGAVATEGTVLAADGSSPRSAASARGPNWIPLALAALAFAALAFVTRRIRRQT
jgi:hypothetical protein